MTFALRSSLALISVLSTLCPQHEQRPLDFADFLKRDVELVLSVDRRAKGTPLAG